MQSHLEGFTIRNINIFFLLQPILAEVGIEQNTRTGKIPSAPGSWDSHVLDLARKGRCNGQLRGCCSSAERSIFYTVIQENPKGNLYHRLQLAAGEAILNA